MKTKIILITTASLLAIAGAMHLKNGGKGCPLKNAMEVVHNK
ncbi:MAG: hypothetical protein K0R65_2058 [Crocinitomicaceae bacterium]|jgi:hypothetical protein|nr:hypothetical protein [Crocinitomicaceae bacterium]